MLVPESIISPSNMLLEDLLIEEFQKLYYQFKADNIYGVALLLDQFYIPNFLSLSTEQSIFSEQEDRRQYLKYENKWSIELWKHKTNLAHKSYCFEITDFSDNNASILYQVYQDNGISKEQQSNLERCLASLAQAKEYLTKVYRLNPENIIFLMHMHNQPQVTVDSALFLNQPSSLLYECIANIKSENKTSSIPTKLSQIDKDFLIDFAQTIRNLESDDPLLIAHHAYLLSLEPTFSTTRDAVQNLILYIAAIDGENFSMNQQEVLERIQNLYDV